MNKEEIKFYSIGRGNLNLDGKFYYGLDYAITDFMRNLEQENNKLKNKIDKAIDYLEQEPVIEINGEFRNIYSEDDDRLLKILKDSEVDDSI